jgi:hypothetical protein
MGSEYPLETILGDEVFSDTVETDFVLLGYRNLLPLVILITSLAL